jgi:signal transduction histidine kinase
MHCKLLIPFLADVQRPPPARMCELQKYLMKSIVHTKVINMKNWNALIVVILLLTATFFIMQLALANESPINSSNKTELVSFVEFALAYAQENGKDQALDEFSNKTGSFVRKDLYIYAYDFNGTCLAHPFKPDWIGKNKLDVTDSNGVPSLRNTLNVAREGKGFTYFIFPNPARGNRDEFKIAYAMKVDENWFLGSGIYISCS